MREHKNLYSKESNPNATGYVDDQIYCDLFPYKIKDRDLFYHRDHPENIHPESLSYINYWNSFIEKCIEGYWIEDKDGTWVYMMPKLFYYINYVVILNEDRNKIQPDLCDLEWIFFTYFLCMDGFSGFEEDDEYTCNRLIERYEKSKDPRLSLDERESFELNEIEVTKIPDSCYSKKTKTFKKFIDPWYYLTRTYLIDNPKGSLGRPLYENERDNGLILGARGIRKSFSVFMGDFMHEFSFSGVRRMEDIDKVNNPLLFAMGCGSDPQLQRTLNNIKGFYDDQPGKYRFEDPDTPDSMGPLYKNYQGGFKVGDEFQHIIKGTGNVINLFGSTVQMSVIRPDRTKIVAGDRFRRVYVEEVGFLEYILEVYSANIDSLKLTKRIGSWLGLGTGGDMVSIKGPKKMFEKPEAFNMTCMPYYWKNPQKKITLFIPAQYQKRDLDDGNGFIYLDIATKEILREREKWYSKLDSVTAASRIMFNPIVPDEMLIPSELSVLPKKEANVRLGDVEAGDLFERVANIGELVYDVTYPHGVKFEKDFKNKIHPILEYNVDFNAIDMAGGFIMYEPPPSGIIPEYMYWAIYDPAAKSGEGTSLHSVLIYKHFLAKDGQNVRDSIVAEWIGRLPTLEQNYEKVIKIAKFFNARIFPETNVAGFVEWCRTNEHLSMLQRDSYSLQKEISPGSKRSHYRAGFQMQARMKWWALQRLADWLMEVKDTDEKTGIPLKRNIDFIYSPRILNEIIYYNAVDNFDHISSLLGLMILLGQLEGLVPSSEEEFESDFEEPIIYPTINLTRRRSRLENF